MFFQQNLVGPTDLSDTASLMITIKREGLIELNEDEEMAVLQKVKQTSHDLKRVLTEDEFIEIVRTVKA